MKQPVFTGVCTALVTPFLNGSINYPLLQQLLQHQKDSGIRAVVLSGTTGEAPTLTDAEKITLFQKGKEYAPKGCKIIAGTGSNCTAHTIELSIAAESVGADALLVVAPYYNKSNPDGLFAHFAAIASAVTIPVILYNVPSRTGVDIPVSVYQRLAAIDNIVGVKEASADITKITKIRSVCPSDFYIWSGNDDQIVPVISLGGKGVISVLSNVLPRKTVLMADAALDGDFDTAAALQCQLQPLVDQLFSEVNPIPVKAAMGLVGYDCGPCRLPLGQLTQENYNKLKQLLT